MCLNIYFSEKCYLVVVWCWVWDAGLVRSSWLMSYACLYTTRRLLIQLCLIRNKNENIKLYICIFIIIHSCIFVIIHIFLDILKL